mgnify:FL=1
MHTDMPTCDMQTLLLSGILYMLLQEENHNAGTIYWYGNL